MDKIWDRKSFEVGVIGRCGGDEKYLMTSQNRQKSNAIKTFSFTGILVHISKAWQYTFNIVKLDNVLLKSLCISFRNHLVFP